MNSIALWTTSVLANVCSSIFRCNQITSMIIIVISILWPVARRIVIANLTTSNSGRGTVSWKSRKLSGSEKPFVKLRHAYSVKLAFSYVVTGIKIKLIAKSQGACLRGAKPIKLFMWLILMLYLMAGRGDVDVTLISVWIEVLSRVESGIFHIFLSCFWQPDKYVTGLSKVFWVVVGHFVCYCFSIFKTIQNCHLCSVDCFHILDHASTTFQLKIKESFHIRREQPSLNQQLHHVNLKLSL